MSGPEPRTWDEWGAIVIVALVIIGFIGGFILAIT